MPRSGCWPALWQRDGAHIGRHRDRTGRVIDVNLVDSVFSLMEGMLPEYAMDGRVRQPVGAAIATASPTNTYPCADGKWLCIAGNSDLIFRRLMTAIGRPELGADPRYATNGDRCAPARRTGRGDRRLDPAAPCRAKPRRCWKRPRSRARACTTSPIARRTRISWRASRCCASRIR